MCEVLIGDIHIIVTDVIAGVITASLCWFAKILYEKHKKEKVFG